MGFSIGTFDYEENDAGLGLSFSDSTSAYRLFGGYQFNDNFAVEGGWAATGDIEDSIGGLVSVSADYEILSVRALGIAPLDRMSLFGGVGYYDADVSVTATVPGIGQFEADGSDSGATLIGGIHFDLKRLGIRAEYEWFDSEDAVDVWDINVGLLFRF
jgi:OOP family OmpA-OmpF porin